MTALILDTSSSSARGGRPIRFLHRSWRRSARLERETPTHGLHREPSFGGDGGSPHLRAVHIVRLVACNPRGSAWHPRPSTHLELRISRMKNRRGLRFPVNFP